MTFRPLVVLTPALLVLVACMPAPMPTVPAPADSCGARALQHLVGTPLSTFNPGSIKGPVRVLAPGSMMTMDHRPDRVNIYHNARGVVEKVTCG